MLGLIFFCTKSKMVSFVSCLKQLVLVWLRANEGDFVAGKGSFIGKKITRC